MLHRHSAHGFGQYLTAAAPTDEQEDLRAMAVAASYSVPIPTSEHLGDEEEGNRLLLYSLCEHWDA